RRAVPRSGSGGLLTIRVSRGRREASCRSPDVELDALGERQAASIVHGVGGAAHIGLPGIRAGFAAAASLLLAAKRAADLGAGRTDIDVGDAAIRASRRHEQFGLAQVI